MEEAVYRNIGACVEIAKIVRTSFGPNGMNKMILNHLDKLFVTNDAATIIKELEVERPAAKLVILASQQQEHEAGDSTNLVIILAGKLLEKAETLLRMVSLSCLLRLFLFFLVCSVCSAYCCRFKAVKIAHKRIRMHMHTHV